MQTHKYIWPEQLESIISCVLGLKSDAIQYDRNYLLRMRVDAGQFFYKPLFPAVVQAYRSLLWNEIMDFVHNNECRLLEACHESPGGTVAHQLYKYMIIQRIIASGLKIPWKRSSVPIEPETCSFTMFSGSHLPPLPSSDGVWVPWNSNFPSIDFFIKSRDTMIGFHLHTSNCEDVSRHFFALCEHAGWFDSVPEIGLVYLSPTVTTKRLVENLVNPRIYSVNPLNRGDSRKIRRIAMASSDIKRLRTVKW